MGLTLTTAVPPKAGRSLVPVPDEVDSDLRGLADHLAENPDELAVASFESEQERNLFVQQLRSWCDMNGYIPRKVKGGDSEPTQYVFRLWTPQQIADRKAEREEAEARREQAKANGQTVKRGRPSKQKV